MSALPLSRPAPRSTAVRQGYSLIELLVSLGIVALLIGLIFTAGMSAMRTAKRTASYVSQEAINIAARSDTPLHVPSPPPARGAGPDEVIPDRYIIEFGPTVTNPAEAAQNLAAAYSGGKVLYVYDIPEMKGCSLFVPGVTADRLQTQAGVQSVEQDRRFRACAEIIPAGVRRIGQISNIGRNLPKLTPASVGLPDVSNGALVRSTSSNIVIVVMDTGVDATHPDLNVGFAKPFGPFAPVTDDVDGHGTHCAGTIAAKVNGQGVVGVAAGFEIWNLRVLDDTGSGSTSDITAALNYVRTNAAQIRVVNMSLGGGFSSALNNAVNRCADAGVIVCVAAGNDADDARFYSPASASKAVCVGAICDTDGKFGGQGPRGTFGDRDDGYASSFSNYGSTVDVVGPGEDVLSTVPVIQGSYGTKSGTSMATPHIAGLMALYGNSFVTQNGKRRPATGLEIAAMLAQAGSVDVVRGPRRNNYPLLLDRLSKKP